MTTLDHLTLAVDDVDASSRFYTDVIGFASDGTDGPFTVIRVSPESHCMTLELQTALSPPQDRRRRRG